MDYEGGVLRVVDPGVMRKAVAFCQTIAKSKAITEVFNNVMESYGKELTIKEGEQLVEVTSQHIDGAMGAAEREKKMSWLKDEPENQNECRILTNVRCLSEGVDVPSLDAVMFLSAKNSQIEVVQSVGRVMRRAKGKKFGYIIIPVITPTYVKPEDVLKDHATFSVVWTVLNALKAHDDRFTALITKIDLNEHKPDGGGSVLIGGIAKASEDNELSGPTVKTNDLLGEARKHDLELYNSIYARLVTKIGDKDDLLLWAQDVAKIAEGFKERITTVISQKGPHKTEFEKFLTGLRQTLNPSVDTTEAIEMLAQHLITKPVFEALFEGSSFVQSNPVSQSLEAMIDILEDQGLEKDKIILNRFYKKVENTIGKIDNAEAKQKIIVNLYDNFFKIVAPKAVEKLGIVYTPVEIVDFIINSVAEVLKKEFGRNISDEGVHILDPFTGTGTFITRLIQSGVLGKSLEKKYNSEIYANEIILLAYYIASINIENAFHYAINESTAYQPFKGICLTDTFQLYESNQADVFLEDRLKKNTERVKTQRKTPIQVITGNPPYSVGQRSANDNAQNQSYLKLEKRIDHTYASKSQANLLRSLYDSYIKAFRWATDRIGKEGVVAFVSSAGWLDGNAMDGMRKCLAEEFSKIYVFNLRGNCRTSGELRQKEAGNVFGLGSRTPIAITILIKNPKHKGQAEIYHHDIGDYLTREQKLDIVKEKHDIYNPDLTWERIVPNEAGDWLNQRNESFENYICIGDKNEKNNKKTFFDCNYAHGICTNRDFWCFNSSKISLSYNIKKTISFYHELLKTKQFNDINSTQISLSRGIKNNLLRNNNIFYNDLNINIATYRPFFKQFFYFDNILNEMRSNIPNIFPSSKVKNLVICVPGIGVTKEFSTIIANIIPDYELIGKSQCFPRYYYEEDAKKKATLLAPKDTFEGYTRHDAITDYIYKESQAKYGSKVTKDDIFYYVYGLLHSEDYRTTFSADLKKMLPRIPLVDKAEDFLAFSKAGRDLADIHLSYETVKPYNKVTIIGEEKGDFTVDKIRFIKKDDKSAIQYNHAITITNIPLEAYDYVVNGRSAIEWILDRYQVKTDKDSGITNDPNDWAKEHNQPRYILDLLLRIITVSLETIKIVKSLPKLQFK
jgi:predicted helicase